MSDRTYTATISKKEDGTFSLSIGYFWMESGNYHQGMGPHSEHLSLEAARGELFSQHPGMVLSNDFTPPEPVYGCVKFWHYHVAKQPLLDLESFLVKI